MPYWTARSRCRETPGSTIGTRSSGFSRRAWGTWSCTSTPSRRFGRPAAGYEGLASVKPLEWSFIQGQVFFRVEKDRLPREYELAYTALPVGLTLYEVRHVVVSNLIVQGFQLDGVNAHDNVFDTSLIGLTCRGNGRSGISIGGASRVRLESCLVGDNGAAQVRTEGFSRTEIADSQLLENTAPAIVREGGLVTRRP